MSLCLHSPWKLGDCSLAWPEPFRREKREKVNRGGVKEEGFGDSEQEAVLQWNVIIRLLLQIT